MLQQMRQLTYFLHNALNALSNAGGGPLSQRRRIVPDNAANGKPPPLDPPSAETYHEPPSTPTERASMKPIEPRPKTVFRVDVNEEQIRFYQENGYLALERIAPDDEIEWLQSVYDRLFESRAGEEDGAYFDLAGPRAHQGRETLPQVLGPERVFPELRETNCFQNGRAAAAKLLQTDLEQVNGGGHMILKPARYGQETPWHQDEAYWNPAALHNGLSVWTPLDNASVESGCMQFIPKSHASENVLPHRHIDNDPLVHGLVTDHAQPENAVSCPLKPGGATFHHCRTLHYAGPNRTDQTRRAYINVFNAPPQKRGKPDHRPWLAEEQEALKKLSSLAR